MEKLMYGKTTASLRDPAEKAAQIESIFMNFDSKYSAPEFIDPEFKDYDQQRFIEVFSRLEQNILKAEQNLDLTQICNDFELPGMGPMTRLEWIAFVNFHTLRHINQLEKMPQS
jgi:hypothetical protein